MDLFSVSLDAQDPGGVVSQEEWLSLGIDPGRGEELGARIRQQAEEAKASALQLG